jgi:hypothetical protein
MPSFKKMNKQIFESLGDPKEEMEKRSWLMVTPAPTLKVRASGMA